MPTADRRLDLVSHVHREQHRQAHDRRDPPRGNNRIRLAVDVLVRFSAEQISGLIDLLDDLHGQPKEHRPQNVEQLVIGRDSRTRSRRRTKPHSIEVCDIRALIRERISDVPQTLIRLSRQPIASSLQRPKKCRVRHRTSIISVFVIPRERRVAAITHRLRFEFIVFRERKREPSVA